MKCQFESKNGCKALGCFSSQNCSCRDKRGYPIYSKIVYKKNIKISKVKKSKI